MSFDDFLSRAWNDHAHDSLSVASRLRDGLALLEKPEQVAPFAGLVVHVHGEHLGEWHDGLALLGELKGSRHFSGPEAESAVRRGVAALLACERGSLPAEGLGPSERLRALAVAASALSARGQGERAEAFFREALQLSAKFAKDDPAIRDLAVASNNLASALEAREACAFRDTELMLMAAHAARKFWELAGTWLEVERAEYRLAMSFLAAGRPQDSRRHAELCLETCAVHDAPAIEHFFAQEALGLAFAAGGDTQGARNALARARDLFSRLPEDERPWCADSMAKLEKALDLEA